MLLTFGSARNHGEEFLKLCQTSFSGIVNYRLIFSLVMKVFDKSFDESNTDRRVKYQVVFQMKAPNDIVIVKLKRFHLWANNLGVEI